MRKAENKHIKGQWIARLTAIVMAALLTAASLPAGFTYADTDSKKLEPEVNTEEPVREVHKVKIENKKYCFFVTHYVVMTPKEIAEFGDNDEKLTDEILKRAGLYMIEANCKDGKHMPITPKEWKKKGGTITLSPVEIYETVEVEKADTPDEAGTGDDSSSDTSTDVPAAGSDGDVADTPDADSDGDVADTPDADSDGDAAETPDADSDGNAADTPDAGNDSDAADTGEKESAKETTTRAVKVEATEALRKAVPSDGDPVRIYTDLIITTKTPKKGSTEEPKKYSTFKKNSPNTPKLIYIAVATEKDAKLGEAICEEKEEKFPDDNGMTIDPKKSGESEDILPEYKTINMTDRSGKPIEPTLEEGDPVTLEWVEPGKKTDSEGKSSFFDHSWAIPVLAAAAIALAAALVLILKRRRETEEEYGE